MIRFWRRKQPQVLWDAIFLPGGAVRLTWKYPGSSPFALDRTRGQVTVPSAEAAKQVIRDVCEALEKQL